MSLMSSDLQVLFLSAAGSRTISIADVKQAVVGRYSSVSVRDLESRSRKVRVVRPRQMAMYLAKKLTTHSLPEIGQKFGRRDHTTVLHGIRRVEELMSQEDAMIYGEGVRDAVLELKKQLEGLADDPKSLFLYFSRVFELSIQSESLQEKFKRIQDDIRQPKFVTWCLHNYAGFDESQIERMIGLHGIEVREIVCALEIVDDAVADYKLRFDIEALEVFHNIESMFRREWRELLPNHIADRVNAL